MSLGKSFLDQLFSGDVQSFTVYGDIRHGPWLSTNDPDRKIPGPDLGALTKDYCPFNGIRQLADISRPIIGRKFFLRFPTYFADNLSRLRGILL